MSRKNKSLFLLIWILIATIIFSPNVFAEDVEYDNNYSKKYEEWLQLSDEEKEKTIPPLSFNVRNDGVHLKDKIISLLKASEIPERYDLREHIDVEVKNQKSVGECWAFSLSSVLETTLRLKGEECNFSERHVDYATAQCCNDGVNSMAINNRTMGGAFADTGFSYYANGIGPILEEDMPYEENEDKISINDLPRNISVKKVDDMLYFPNIYKSIDSDKDIKYMDANENEYSILDVIQIREKIKEHIIEYGAIGTNIYMSGDFLNSSNASYNNNKITRTNHAVTIIGWDDNYSKENFKIKPKNDGAYIVLNSWGDQWGDNGCFYISYEDLLVESQIRGVKNISNIEYDNIYQYDLNDVIYKNIKSKFAANIFTCLDDEKLTEIMVGTLSNQSCNVYVNNDNNELNINNLIKVAENVRLEVGYNTIKLTNAIELQKGKKFAIVIEILDEDFEGIGIVKNKNFMNIEENSNKSMSSNDGVSWEDLYYGVNSNIERFCIKAYTQKNTKELKIKDIIGYESNEENGEIALSLQASYLDNNQNINVRILKNNVDVTNEFEIKGNKIRGNGAFLRIIGEPNINIEDYFVEISIEGYEIIRRSFDISDDSELTVKINCKDENFCNFLTTGFNNYKQDNDLILEVRKKDLEFSKYIDISYNNALNDITGIEYFSNLRKFDASVIDVDNLKLIGELSLLEDLNLFHNKSGDLWGECAFLENLVNLKKLNLKYTDVRSLEFLKELTNLEELSLENNHIDDFSNIGYLKKLEILNINYNKINQIDFLEDLQNLKILYLSNSAPENNIDMSSIFTLKNLEELDLQNWNWITENDLKDINQLNNLKELILTDCNIESLDFISGLNLNLLYIGNNHFSDLSPIKNMKSLTKLSVKNVKEITNLNQLENLENLNYLNFSGCSIKDATILDSNKFKKINWKYLDLNKNRILEIKYKNELDEKIFEVPNIIRQACDENSILYSKNGVELEGCSWEEYGVSVKIDNDENSFYINIKSGYAKDSKWIEVFDYKSLIKFEDDNFGKLIFDSLNTGDKKINYDNKTIIADIDDLEYLSINPIDEVSNITGINQLKNLKSIFIEGCNIQNLAEISKLKDLTGISLNNMKLENVRFICDIPSIEYINLFNTGLEDVNYLNELPNLVNINLSNDYSLEEEQSIIILPNIFKEQLNNNVKLKAGLYIDSEKNQNEYIDNTEYWDGYYEDLPIFVNEDKNLYIEVDYSIDKKKKAGNRFIRVLIENGKYENSTFNYNYYVENKGIEYEEFNNQKVITRFDKNNNKFEDIITIDNFPTATTIEVKNIDGKTLTKEDKLGTGTVITLLDEEKHKITNYIVAIRGDIDGNGEIDIYDPLRLIELVMDTDEDYYWEDYLRIAGNCLIDEKDDYEDHAWNPDIYDILRLIEYYFDGVQW